jgi:hypothetical protein
MTRIPSIIATLATGPALKDLELLLASLSIFNANPPIVYLFCDSNVADSLSAIRYSGPLVHKVCLDRYAKRSRIEMEMTPGRQFKNMWFDFMTEKINLLRWVFEHVPEAEKAGVMFCDADICFTGPLPEIPDGIKLALSPHYIRDGDEAKYGHYNGGYLWMLEASSAEIWWKACPGARFYEQSALEDLAAKVKEENGFDTVYEFPITENYGWWRLWQGPDKPDVRMKQWDYTRQLGITVGGKRLGSVHTHFHEKHDGATMTFNGFVLGWLRILEGSNPAAKRLLAAIRKI